MKFLPLKFNSTCLGCGEPASVIVQNSHVQRQFEICAICKESLCYVRVHEVLHVYKTKRERKTRRWIKITDKRKSLVRFPISFRELAICKCGELVLLHKGRYANSTSLHVIKDNRNATEYLLDNPPFNKKGERFRVIEGIERDPTFLSSVLKIADKASPYPHLNTVDLETAYNKITSRNTNALQRVGASRVTTLSI